MRAREEDLPRLDQHHRRLLGIIVDGGSVRQVAQERALAGEQIEGLLVGLIGSQPQILPQRIVVAVDADGAGGIEKASKPPAG